MRWISGARERQGGSFTEAQRPGAAEQGAARRGCTVAAARVVRVGSRGSGWFKEPWPKISACGIGRKGCGHHGRGSRGDTARRGHCSAGKAEEGDWTARWGWRVSGGARVSC